MSILTPTPASADGWIGPGLVGGQWESCIEGATGPTHIHRIGGGGDVLETDWEQVTGNENNFSLVIEFEQTEPALYSWYLSFVTTAMPCAGYRGGYFDSDPGVPRFDPLTECTWDVTESDNESPGVLADLQYVGMPVPYFIYLEMPAQTGSPPFTYTVDFTCSDEEPEGPGPGDGISFDYRLPVSPAALPDTL